MIKLYFFHQDEWIDAEANMDFLKDPKNQWVKEFQGQLFGCTMIYVGF